MRSELNKARFSWLYAPGSSSKQPSYDVILDESEGFAVLPSLGALVAGWTLIVPKNRTENFSQLSINEKHELRTLSERVVSRLSNLGGKVYCFEHGGHSGSLTSCGVDQAHLHLVPLPFDLFQVAWANEVVDWRYSSPIHELNEAEIESSEYLFVSDFNKHALGTVRTPQSQWFRKLIATNLEQPRNWDYRKHPNWGNIVATCQAFAA